MTNPSTEQIESAALPIFEAHAGFAFADDLRGSRAWSHALETAEVALVAAAGVTPPEPGEVLQRTHEVIDGVYANELGIPAYMLSRQAALALKQDGLLAAPVRVDEAKLADVIAPLMPGAVTESGATGHTHTGTDRTGHRADRRLRRVLRAHR